MTRPHPSAPVYVKLLLAILSVVLFLGVAELALRLLDANFYYKNQFVPVNRDIDFPEVYKRDPDLFWRFRPNMTTHSRQFSYLDYHINSLGMRGNEITNPKRGYRILALGNSCTFGWGVPQQNIWSVGLQQLLQNRIPGRVFEVANAGVPGYSSFQGKLYFKELLSLKPDMVLIMFAWNDHAPAGKGICDVDQRMPNRAVLWLQNMFGELKLYQLMRKLILTATEKQEQVPLDRLTGPRRVPLDQFSDNLKEIIQTARSNGVVPILIVPPIASLNNYFATGTVSDLHSLHATYQAEIRRVGQYYKVPVVDLQSTFDKFNELYDDAKGDCTHFNAKGHVVAAESVADVVSAQLQ